MDVVKQKNDWKEVWNKKGFQNKDLHQLDGWDHLEKKQWDNFLSNSFFPIKDYLKNIDSIMELGCGAGAAIRFINENYPNILLNGFDYSESLIKICKDNIQGNFWVDDAQNEKWVCEDEKYDFVFNVGTFIYLENEEYALEVLKKMYQTSKSGKILIIDISDKEKEELAKKLRKETHQSSDKIIKEDLKHLYLPKSLFENFAKDNNCDIKIFNQIDICNFDWNLSAPYRYNVLIEKK